RLKEGSIYWVKNFLVQVNKEEFRVMRYVDFMLDFDGDTTIRKASVKSEGFNRYPFQFVEINDLEPTNNRFLVGGCIQTGGIIVDLDADKDVTLEDVAAKEVDAAKDVEVEKNADVQGRLEESQAQVYHIDLEDADEVLSMHDDEPKPGELKEVIEVVTTTKLMTEVVTVAVTTAASTITVVPSAARRRKGVVIRDPEETANPSIIQAHIEQDEACARELEAELNKNINWNDVIEHVKEKGKQDNAVLRYQALKRKPQTEAQARKNMTKSKEQLEGEASMALKKKSESSEPQAAKKQKLDEEVEELKKHLQIVPNEEDDVYTEATPLALKIVQERFASSKPKNFLDDFLLTTLKTMFEKPDIEAQAWKNQKGIHGLAKVKSWKLLESCGVHIITFTTTQMILLVERRYPLTRFTVDQMLNNVRLEVEKESEVSLELLRFVQRKKQEGYRPE
nr:hypothetical protein [Tanacetum cinerariifolium]